MSNITERNYYTGMNSDGEYKVIQFLPHEVRSPPSIPGLLNGSLVAQAISERLTYLQHQINQVVKFYISKKIIDYRYTLEAALVSMKRVMDDLVMSSYCLIFKRKVLETKHIEVDTYGSLFNKEKPTKVGEVIINKTIQPTDDFGQVITELVNSLKHSYLLPEAQLQWGVDFPTVVSIYAHRNKYGGEITYHNHSLGQIIIGFNQFVSNVVALQKNL
ncbi:TPA: hypothetical protein NJ142_004279 [Vibrio parahaemolyticus]|nr:hypothetical protein [Vibrio parahaemolyticus]